jgi:hypothetical protein
MRVLLTGARAPATLELARLCARSGHEVHVADTSWWHICRGSRLIRSVHQLPSPRAGRDAYATALSRLIDTHAIEIVIPTCEEVFHIAAIRDRLQVPVTAEALDRLAPLHDKWRFIDACNSAGVRAPVTHLITAANQLRDLPVGEYAVKPRYSRFATNVHRWRSGTTLPSLNGAATDGWVAQELVRGSALCTWSVAHRGAVLSHVTYAVDDTAGTHGAAISFHSVRHTASLQWVTRFVAHHVLSGQFAFDFFETANDVLAIECNPRLTSGVHCFRALPKVADALLMPSSWPPGVLLEPEPEQQFRSRLALAASGKWHASGAGLLDAHDDPWPRRLQLVSWTHLLGRALLMRQDPRRVSTRDIEWNGEP